MRTRSLRLQAALLLGRVLHHRLRLVEALLRALREPAPRRRAQLPRLLCAPRDRGVLLHLLLGRLADLARPLGALGEGGVAGRLILALLVLHRLALHHIVLHVMDLLLRPALRLVLRAADLGALDVAVLDKRRAADLDSLIEGDLLVLDEAALAVVLLALLLLLRLVGGDVAGVAAPVVAVIALDDLVILRFLDHLDLVDAALAVGAGFHGSDVGEGDAAEAAGGRGTLASVPARQLDANCLGVGRIVVVVIMVVAVLQALVVEGEGVDEGLLLAQQLTACQAAAGQQQ